MKSVLKGFSFGSVEGMDPGVSVHIAAVEEMGRPATEKLLRDALENRLQSRRRCCCVKFQAAWAEKWGKPMHSVSLSDLVCCCTASCCRTEALPEWQKRSRSKICFNAELDVFFPPNIDDSTSWREIIEAAKARRRACFDGFADAQPHAPVEMPPHTDVAGIVPVPHDLLLFSVVLPYLPLPDVFRARLVCRFWHEILSSPLHLRRLIENPDYHRPRLVIQTSTPNHSSCLAVFDGDHWFPNHIPLPTFCLRAAAGGLFCFSFETALGCWEDCILLVGNPITQQWRRLPPFPKHVTIWNSSRFVRAVACTMWADPSLGCYKVFVNVENVLYMYDSSSSQWEKQGYLPCGISAGNYCRRDFSVTPSGLLHQLSYDGQVVTSYNMEKRSTAKTYGPSNMDPFQLKQPYSRLPALVYCNNAVYVVARMRAAETMVGGRMPWVIHGPVAIWELHVAASGNAGRWGWPVSVAPQDLLQGAIEGSDGTDFCITTDGNKMIYLVLPGGASMLIYDVLSGVWSALPGCPPAFLVSFDAQPYYVPLLWLGSV